MLVLTRRANEELIVDGCIRVTVLSIQGQRVRLGISAPGDVTIRRAEIECFAEQQADHHTNCAESPELVHA